MAGLNYLRYSGTGDMLPAKIYAHQGFHRLCPRLNEKRYGGTGAAVPSDILSVLYSSKKWKRKSPLPYLYDRLLNSNFFG